MLFEPDSKHSKYICFVVNLIIQWQQFFHHAIWINLKTGEFPNAIRLFVPVTEATLISLSIIIQLHCFPARIGL